MSKCEIYSDKVLLDYLQNKQNREEMEKVQFHLNHCVDCREKLERMRCLTKGLQTIDGQEKRESFQLSSLLRIAAMIALLLMVSVGSYLLIHTSVNEDSTIIITQPPEYNSSDSLDRRIDSMKIIDKKDTLLYESE